MRSALVATICCVAAVGIGAGEWLVFRTPPPTPNQVGSYYDSVILIRSADTYIQQSFKDSGPKRALDLTNALQWTYEARLKFNDFQPSFDQNAIDTNALYSILINDSSDLVVELGNSILGQHVNESQIHDVDADYQRVVKLLPVTNGSHNVDLQKVKQGFDLLGDRPSQG